MTLPKKMTEFVARYLLERGIVDETVLEQARAEQSHSETLLGELACSREYLRPEDAERIFETQKSSDKPFGEIAVELELLTTVQLDDLLFLQDVRTCHLGEALLAMGAIDDKQFEAALEAFAAEQERSRKSVDSALADHPQQSLLRGIIKALETASSRFMKERVKVLGVCMLESLDDFELQFSFFLRSGDGRSTVCTVLLDNAFAVEIAGHLSGQYDGSCREACLAQCLRFMEIVERYFVESMARQGAEPVQHSVDAALLADRPGLAVPVLSVIMGTPGWPMKLAVVVHEE
ncbi:hypothetical protein [Oceanidesulfovibrio marinus]|nr:hypothetical protein [Oceanidesulfovibrio marinus]